MFNLFFPAILSYLLLFSNVYSSISTNLYSIKDLQLLAQSKEYKEFFSHAKDIKPTGRTAEWKNLLENMAIQALDDFFIKNDFSNKALIFANKLNNFTELRSDPFFQIKRTRLIKGHLKKCFSNTNNDNCKKQLLSYWEMLPKESFAIEIGLDLGKSFHRFLRQSELWPFFQRAANHQLSSLYCKEQLIQESLIYYLNELDKDGLPPKQLISEFSSVANDSCILAMSDDLKKLIPSLPRNETDLILTLLREKKLLTKNEESYMLTLFILKGPILGDNFNVAWRDLENLSENFTLRTQILNKLKKLDPLPGALFSTPDTRKRRVLINLFQKNFPEYLHFYAKTCLNYLEGKKDFPAGNPTVDCHDLFRNKENSEWLLSSWIKRYKNSLPGKKL